MRPIITLLTDFGLADSYVAEMKAAIYAEATEIRIVDLSHLIPLGDIPAAQYLLGRAWRRFPRGTVHVVVVDPGVGSSRRAIAVHHHGQFFVGPDNGVFSPVLDGADVVELRVGPDASPTFQGRDVFAPAAARLALGEPFGVLGPAITDALCSPPCIPQLRDGVVDGVVVHVDRFGTLVSNIAGDMVAGATAVEVEDTDVGPLKRTFADVARGDPVAYVGSGGMLEVAVRDGSATEKLGVGVGTRVTVTLR
jgi:S-adenosylmethionine hydrolase